MQQFKRNLIAAAGLISCLSLHAHAQPLDANTQDFEPTTDWGEPTQQSKTEIAPREPTIDFGVFSEPIELNTLIDFIGSSLKINIVIKGSPTGEIVFNAPVSVPRSKLLPFLDAMLEQYSFTIALDPDSRFYIVQPLTDLKSVFGTSTRIIPTPNIKPSLLVPALSSILGAQTGTNAKTTTSAIQAVDELGILIVNAAPRDIARVEQMMIELISIDEDQEFIRFELDHLAAPIALDRAVGLVGGTQSGTTPRVNQNNPNAAAFNATGSSGSSFSNLSDRMTIDPQGNALIFKGTQNEIRRIRDILTVIDVPNKLEPRNYFAGSSAAQIADIAKRRGLGEVIQIEASQTQNPFNNFGGQNNPLTQNNDSGRGGPVMVVDAERGNIIYYGTDDQQAQLAALMTELKTDDERVVIREYVLNHTDALVIGDLLNGIISGELQTGDSALLPGGANRNNNARGFVNGFAITADGESSGEFDPDKITVIPDESSNQIIIKAPIKQQADLESLIVRLDKRRPQVYIQALIVSVADNEDYTLAFETQINAGQYSMGTNFGLSSPGTTFQDPKLVSSSLSGLTQAVIMSEFVPIIVNATQTNANVRILSTPQLLVNNNEESTIMSVEEQPYSEITAGTGTGDNIQGLGGYVEVGTTLTVTPSISESGFIRLEYNVELSNFVGLAQNGLPPGTNRRTVEGSATVPADSTIVIGGITVDDIRDTIIKVPFLGDIPLLGELFKRTNKVNNKSKLYVFLTPRIMSDPNFNDLKLFSKGPQKDMDIDNNIPDLQPAIITSPDAQNTRTLPAFNPSNSAPQTQSSESPASQSPVSVIPAEDKPAQPPELEPAYIELTEAQLKDND